MKRSPKTNEQYAVGQVLDDTINKLARLRELLFDATIFAVAKHVLQKHTAGATVTVRSRATEAGQYGGIVRAAFESVREMGDEPFSKRDLAQKLREAGHEIRSAKNALFYPVQKLLADGVIERVVQGGGGRSNLYRLVNKNHGEECGDCGDGVNAGQRSAAQEEPRLKNATERTAFECVRRMNEPFAKHELIRAMKTAGQVFVANADRSVGALLQKFVRQGILVQEVNGREPLFRRRTAE